MLEFNPKDKYSVLGRAWAKLFMNDTAGAYQDAVQYIAMDGHNEGDAAFAAAIAYIALAQKRRPGEGQGVRERCIKESRPIRLGNADSAVSRRPTDGNAVN